MERRTAEQQNTRSAEARGYWATSHRVICFALVLLLCPLAHVHPTQPAAVEQPNVLRFEALDVLIDSGAIPLAAYQVQITAIGGEARVVGIEGGGHAAYAQAPYYDPRALHEGHINERIIIAAFSIADELPVGATRIARVQFAVQGAAEYEITLQAAGAADGRRIEATVDIVPARQ